MSHREDKSFTVQSRTGKVVVVNQGYLKKKSPKTFMGFAQWQDRFFVLEKDKFLYYKTDRARSMGEPASGVIPVSEIRSVSLPQDHKDGCRLSIETSSRRIYDLQAASASECQRWLNLLTTQCREIGTLADFSDEAAVDAAHERDLALMLVQNQQKGQQATDASGQPMVLGADPDFTEDELIAVDAEVVRQMEQFSLSVSLDLQGSNADKIAPFVVIFGPSGSIISSSQPQNPAAAAALAAVHAAADAQNAAAASSTISALEINGSAVPLSSTIPARHPPSYYANLEAVICDANAEKNITEVASSIKLLSVIMLYNEIRTFKLSNSCAAQTTTATNIWQRFLRKGAADFVAFPASASPAIPSPSTASTVSTTPSSPFSFVISSPSSPSVAAVTLSLIDQVHDCLKKRRITLTTFDGILHHILHTLREEFWPVLVQKHPQYLAPLATNPPNLTFNPAQLHPSQRKISGSYNASTGVQIAYNRHGSVVNGNPLGKGWDELSRTEVLPRLGKKALVAGEKPSASATPTTNHGHHGSISGPSGMGMTRGHKQSIVGGELPNLRLGERRHFDILLGVNMEKSLVPATIDKRISRLNGLESLAQQIKRLTEPITNSASAAAKARARRASALQKKPGDSLSPTHRRSSSFEHPVLPIAISPAAIAQAHEKALDDVDASLGRVATQVHSEDTDEDDVSEESSEEEEEEDEDAPPPPTSSPPPEAGTGPSLTINTSQTITVDKNMKTLRFHLYHSTELGSEDLSSHILLSRMECSLKEIITSENGEMSRALFMVDGHGAGLSGFIHVMFHDRRTIKIANTPRYCYRSYIFRDVAGTDLLCHESLQESPFTFQLPHLALLRAADHARIMRKQIMQNLSETDASIVSGKNSVEEESQKSQMLSFMQRQVKAYTAVISQWEKLCKLYYNYSGVFHGLRFKPSVEKGSKALAFVPINCHIQSFSVTVTGRSRSKPAASLGTFVPSNLTRALTAHGTLNPSSSLSPQGLGGSARNLMSTRPHAMTHAQHPNGTQSAELFLPPLEASSFLFEQADFLSELRAAHLRQAKKNAENTTVVAGTSPVNNASVSPASSPSPPPPGAENSVPASLPVTSSSLLTSPIPATRPARGSFKKAAIRVIAARTMPKPASAQTKAVAQMIANSHAMAAASYSSAPGHLRDANSAPAFLTMSLNSGPSPLSGASSSSVHRQTVAEGSGKKEPKLNFTADENQTLTAYTPAMSVGPNGENNLEKARLFRRVPPRSPFDRTYACHNYMNVTCGAFVAHSLGFKQAGGGGMMKLMGRMYEQLGKHAGDVASIRMRMDAEEGVTPASPNPAAQSASVSNGGSAGSKDTQNYRLVHALLESGQKVLSQQWENQQRQHIIVSQAMTALTTSFVAQLLTNLHQIDVWRRIVKIGYLQQVESLLSTFHSEQYMLQDFCYAVRALEHVKVTIVQQTENLETEEDAFGHYVDPVKLNETLKAAAAAANAASTTGGSSGGNSLTLPPPPPNVPPNVPAPDRSRSPSPPPPPPPADAEAAAAAAASSSVVEPASPAPGAGFVAPNNTPAIPPQIRTSSAPAAIVSPEPVAAAESEPLPVMNRIHSLEDEDVPPPPMEPHPAASSASVVPAPTSGTTAPTTTTSSNTNTLAPPLPPRKRTVSTGQRPTTLGAPMVSPASPSQPPASPSTGSGVSSPSATLSPPPAVSPAAIRSVSPSTRKVNTMTMPSPNFISNRITRPQAQTMHQPIQRSPAAVAAAALGSEEDFVSAEDNIPQVAAGMAPTVHQRVQEINTVHISLLVPPTAAPIASLPFATEAPGSTLPNASTKKTKWFSMSSSSSNGTENSAAAQAAAEAAARAASAMPFTTTPSLPHPYSAASVVIVIELPPHLYRLLPVCLRELEPKPTSAAAAAQSTTSNNSLNVPAPSTLSGASSPATPSLNGSDSQKIMEDIAPIGSVPGIVGTLSMPVGSLLNSSGSFDDSTAPLSKASVNAAPVPPTAAPVLTSSDQEAPQLSTPLIDIWPVLITQGVNELQTMANKMGRNELQQEINHYSLEILKAYFIMFAKYQKSHLDVISASSKERLKNGSMLQMIGKDLQACELMIQSFNAEKNIQLLVLCADIVKRMSGGRIVCCKSAKDRTSMAVTWDQARLLYEQHGLSEHDVQSALNLMRTEGVRKLNVVKNTGQSAYAFNMLQRSLLPAIFRPPEHSCSSSIEG